MDDNKLDLNGTSDGDNRLNLDQPDHDHLHAVVIKRPTDFVPYGNRIRNGPDCSEGCKWFLVLKDYPYDWGVCANPKSPRCGLLTFEHQGCPEFEDPPEEDEKV